MLATADVRSKVESRFDAVRLVRADSGVRNCFRDTLHALLLLFLFNSYLISTGVITIYLIAFNAHGINITAFDASCENDLLVRLYMWCPCVMDERSVAWLPDLNAWP